MIFNGHTEEYINSLDEELFGEIQVMYADGMLGNKGIFDSITPLTTACFNYMRGANTPVFKANDLFPWINEYSLNPDDVPTIQEKSNSDLLGFISQAPQFNLKKFKNVG
jgi:hypothetical protein